MELNSYQDRVVKDLDLFLSYLDAAASPSDAWVAYWKDKDFSVGDGDDKCVPPYHDDKMDAAKVCAKVPTGGGKTFIGTAALKVLCARRRPVGPKFVVWLVPSDAILEQTVRNFKNPEHHYRRRLNADFGGKVEVFTKDELLNGQNFSPDTVNGNLCVAIFCYNSIRAKPSTKDDRKVYQENGNLQKFESYFQSRELLMADTPETALIQVIRRMRPMVVVDESHNVGTNLSIEMLKVLGADFVLSMTATPRNNGRTENVFAYVGANELKAEHMVKLPVVVYNKASVNSVVQNALDLRAALERAAKKEERDNGGRYIRPIVLFQAQPRNEGSSETYDKIKEKLVSAGIPEEQVKIKTGDKDELRGIDLMDVGCPVRFIITVNALKEGWDCPFAYILASLANRSSQVDVEQVVGRVLRQPYAKDSGERLLNMSYVLTSSDDFQSTADNIVKGLNNAGFGERDLISGEKNRDSTPGGDSAEGTQSTFQGKNDDADDASDTASDIGAIAVPSEDGGTVESSDVTGMMSAAGTAAATYAKQQTENPVVTPTGVIVSGYAMQSSYAPGAKMLKIPQFVIKVQGGFSGIMEEKLLEREDLLDKFSLVGQDAVLSFTQAEIDAYVIDVASAGSGVARAGANSSMLEYIAKRMEDGNDEQRSQLVVDLVFAQLNKYDNLGASEIKDYVRRVLKNLPSEQFRLIAGNVYAFSNALKKKIRQLEDVFCSQRFQELVDDEKVSCVPYFVLPDKLYPSSPNGSIDKSLYRAEPGDMNGDELLLANDFAACENVEWWHRIKERAEGEFRINGKCEGSFNHYPDFIVKMNSGKILLVECKGDDRDNSDSKAKIELGKRWETMAGSNYRYFMVFHDTEFEGAMTRTKFLDELNKL